jgi:S-adenosylhomocysteine hydrolase
MPSFELVSAYARSLLRQGVDATETRRLHAYVMNGRPTPTRVQADQLARLSALFKDYFTAESKDVWSKLTGIDVDDFKPGTDVATTSWPTTLRRDRTVLEQQFPLTRKKNGALDVEISGVDVDELSHRRAAQPAPATLDGKEAVALKLPTALIVPALERADSRTVEWFTQQLGDIVRTRGDNNHRLRPRNLAGADETVTAVMKQVYASLGERVLSLDEIRSALPQAIAQTVLGGTSKANRHAFNDLFRRTQEDVVDGMVRSYAAEVVEHGGSHTVFLERHGLTAPMDKRRFLDVAQPLMPKPTLQAMSALYERALNGELAAKDFYNAAGIDQDALFMLEARLPEQFPRPDTLKESQALAASHSTKDLSVDEAARAWHEQVVEKGLTVDAFIAASGMRSSVLQRYRNEHPKRFPAPQGARPPPARGEDFAAALNAALLRVKEAEPFLKVKQLLERVSADPDFVKKHGEVSYERYYAARRENPDAFVRMDASSQWEGPVLAQLEQLMKQSPELSRAELVRELQKQFPDFTYSRLTHIKERHPDLTLPGEHGRRDTARIDDVAARVKELLSKEPLTLEQLSEKLKPELGDIEPLQIGNIIRTQRRALFTGVQQIDQQRLALRRMSLPARELLPLALVSAPPGSSTDELGAAYNRLLSDRGLPTYKPDSLAVTVQSTLRKLGWPNPDDYYASVAADVVAEYARAAPAGTPEDQILKAVFKDYPRLERRFTHYRREWEKAPKQYASLAPFFKAGHLTVRGQGHAGAEPRYLGGWDAGRAAMRAPPADRQRLAELTEYAAIPMQLSEVDAVVGDHGAQKLNNVKFLWVSHLLEDIVPMALAMKDASLNQNDTTVVGSPYGSNPAIVATLKDLGFNVRVPKLSEDDYRAEVKKALDKAIAGLRGNDAPLLIMDDGGLTADLLHSDPKYAPVLDRIRIVEQTTGGVLLAEEHALKTSVVAVARAKAKAVEGEGVGQVIAEKIIRRLKRSSGDLKGKRIVVLGNGPIGAGIIDATAAAGARVTLIEPNPEMAKKVPRGVAAVTDPGHWKKARAAALAQADIVIGATGRNSVTLEDLLSLKDGAIALSASSKRKELSLGELEKVAKRTELPDDNPLVRVPTTQYTYKGKKLVVLGDGWPLNFDGGVASLPPARIALTDAAMLDGLFQASSIQGRRAGLVDFDPAADARLLERHAAALKAHPDLSVYDIDAWPDVLRSAAALYA